MSDDIDIQHQINKLLSYALDKKLISENEKYYSVNLLLDVLNIEVFKEEEHIDNVNLEETLNDMLNWSYSQKLFKENTTVYRDLFDTKIMNCFTLRPDSVVEKFNALYKKSPQKATSWFYQYSIDTNYIRKYRVDKDLFWQVDSPYGKIDLTINLSKPEKDPKAIALAKKMPSKEYPLCNLCKENQGYRGNLKEPARENLRLIPLKLDSDNFYLQYSPYSYFNEHCIVFNSNHVPMAINEKTFRHLFSFVDQFPDYVLGSNADLPIVGGSILSHDHYQGGNYYFPMFKAKELFKINFNSYSDIDSSLLLWPLTVIRLKGKNKERIISLSLKILNTWINYSDFDSFIFAYTDNIRHNTLTPILHKENGSYVFYLVLRNNITTDEYPLGYFHPHKEYWNIKKENIGLIEVMGRAILPSRLYKEMHLVKQSILNNEDISSISEIKKHTDWVNKIKEKYQNINKENIDNILKEEIGLTFVDVLKCCGVYKLDDKGLNGFKKFIQEVNK